VTVTENKQVNKETKQKNVFKMQTRSVYQ